MDFDILIKTMGNKSKRAIATLIRKVQEKFDAKADLTEVEQKLILAVHKPKTNEPEPIAQAAVLPSNE